MITYLDTPKGTVEFGFSFKGVQYKTINLDNEVLPNAKELIARALGGDLSFIIDTIEVYLDDTLLASASTIPSFPEVGVVKHTAIFTTESFSGPFNKVILKNAINGNFSQLLGFDLTKPSTNLLTIGWKIKPL